MCNTNNAYIINAIIDKRIADNDGEDLFTAYDITKIAKAHGATENHYQMSPAVHDRLSDLLMAGYDRMIISTPTGDCRLYFREDADVTAYINRINQNKAASVPAPVIPSFSTPGNTVVAGTNKTQSLNCNARLPIYSDTLREVGITPGAWVNVLAARDSYGSSFLLIKNKNLCNSGEVALATYRVNADGRIRIGWDVLKKVTASLSRMYSVTTNPQHGVVKVEAA